MNCLTARQTLELARPDEPARAPHDAETVADAARHVEACPTCQVAVARQEGFDWKVGGMIRNVPVPAGLKAGLLSLLEADGRRSTSEQVDVGNTQTTVVAGSTSAVEIPASTPASTAAARSRVGSRRRWLGTMSLAAAALVFVGIGVFTFYPRETLVNPDEVVALLATSDISSDHLPDFTRFKNGLEPKHPETMLSNRLPASARRLGALENVAVFFFTLRGQHGPIQGRLAVIPRRLVVAGKVPAATSFLAPPGIVTYKIPFCITAWCEGDFVYIVILSDENGLQRLLRTHAISA